MAQYNYDEGGSMAAYFALTFLVLVLLPTSFSMLPRKAFSRSKFVGCTCDECEKQRETMRKESRRSLFSPKITMKAFLVLLGWSAVAALLYKVQTSETDTKLYDPFEILGIRMGSEVKDIKRHFKRLSIKYHPDKVKLEGNETMDDVAAKFVEITKAYKALTDETIKKNWEEFGHPDGRQEMSMGIAIPITMVKGGNTIWVLLFYGIMFGGSLPYLVGRWWFSSKAYTKDGVHAKSAASFFKNVREDSSIEEVVKELATVWQYEKYSSRKIFAEEELDELEKKISPEVSQGWVVKSDGPFVRRAIILLYAHFLRLPVQNSGLRKEQRELLIHSPTLLTSLLNITLSRNWLNTSLHVMRLNAYLAQAIMPSGVPGPNILQFPTITKADVDALQQDVSRWNAEKKVFEKLVQRLKSQDDSRAKIIEKVGERWGKLDVVDAYFKVIGEKIVTPGAYVNLVVKLRLTPPNQKPSKGPARTETVVEKEKADNDLLAGRKDAEDLPSGSTGSGYAHSPRWPAPRRPGWWAVLSDDKSGKVVVQPSKMMDIPYSNETIPRNYRTFKTVFQAPQQVGVFTWRLRIISDTMIGEEFVKDMPLKIEDASLLDSSDIQDDEISEPEEDSLAGQMAAMKGQPVKKARDDSSDDESSTDEDDDSDSSSSSDSD